MTAQADVAAVRDPAGLASLGLHNVAMSVSDLDLAIEWYTRVLGFEFVARAEINEGQVALMSGAGTHMELLDSSKVPEPRIHLDPLFADPPRHLLPIGTKFLVFEVDDLATASTELEKLGVRIVWREKEIAPGWVATAIRDFDGNLINIFRRH
jgi:catechol 2,3-dioxygenase-like lactoylglutathione lyase family enzyme